MEEPAVFLLEESLSLCPRPAAPRAAGSSLKPSPPSCPWCRLPSHLHESAFPSPHWVDLSHFAKFLRMLCRPVVRGEAEREPDRPAHLMRTILLARMPLCKEPWAPRRVGGAWLPAGGHRWGLAGRTGRSLCAWVQACEGWWLTFLYLSEDGCVFTNANCVSLKLTHWSPHPWDPGTWLYWKAVSLKR